MAKRFSIPTPLDFSFKHTVQSHGWYDLPPFELGPGRDELIYVFSDHASGRPITGRIRSRSQMIVVELSDDVGVSEIKRAVKHILRLDEDLAEFYEIARSGRINWAAAAHAGRLLRSATVFEDLVKSLCTTNCSWGLTRKMTANLVQLLGEESSDGRRAFPTPSAMASVGPDFYRNEIKAGYRSPYFAELAESVANGDIDPEKWLNSSQSTAELKKEIKKIKGIGDYAAENLLKLLGRYDGLALDSWLRGGFYKKHNRGKPCSDKKIELHYREYRDWRGLAIWCDMTEGWFTEGRESD